MNIQFSKLWLPALFIVLMGCSSEKLTLKVKKGLSDMGPTIDTVGTNLVSSIRKELITDSSRIQLQGFLDSLLHPAFLAIRNTVGSARDSIINIKTLIWIDSLLQAVTGEKLNRNIMALQTAFMTKTKRDIYEIESSVRQLIKNIMADALSDSNRLKIGLFRDELLGSKTSNALNIIIDTAVKHIVDTAVAHLATRIRADINPLLQDDISFIRKNAGLLLTGLAALAAIIITLIWFNRRKYLRMVAMLAKQIDAIPNKEVYDKVTAKIKDEAVSTGLEPTLREVLKDNGLLSSDSWKKNLSQD